MIRVSLERARGHWWASSRDIPELGLACEDRAGLARNIPLAIEYLLRVNDGREVTAALRFETESSAYYELAAA